LTSLTVYQSLAESAQAIWRALAARRGWMIPPSMAQMPEDENATPYECDMAPGETRVQLQVRGHAADLPH
jgi:hypothetical protein